MEDDGYAHRLAPHSRPRPGGTHPRRHVLPWLGRPHPHVGLIRTHSPPLRKGGRGGSRSIVIRLSSRNNRDLAMSKLRGISLVCNAIPPTPLAKGGEDWRQIVRHVFLFALTILIMTAVSHAEDAQTLAAKYKAGGPHAFDTLLEDWHDALRDRKVPVKIYFPMDAKGPAAVVIFSHGLG